MTLEKLVMLTGLVVHDLWTERPPIYYHQRVHCSRKVEERAARVEERAAEKGVVTEQVIPGVMVVMMLALLFVMARVLGGLVNRRL